LILGKNLIKPSLLLVFILHTLNISAQNQELALDNAVSLALEHNLNLRKIDIDLATSGYSEKRLWAEIFPSITASGGVTYGGSALFSGNGFDNDMNNLSYNANFGISLRLTAGIPFAMRSIRLAHQSNILRYEDACSQLAIQITKKYYSLVTEKNNLLLLEEILNLAQREYERSQVSFRNGLIRELSMIQSRLAYENARYSLSASTIAYNNGMAEFLAMLGMDPDSEISLSGTINIVRISADSESLIRQYLPGRPDIARSVQEIERLVNAGRQTAMQARSPSINLQMSWSSSNFDPFNDRLSASANLSIPIDSWIPGTSGSQSIRRANDSVEKARLDLIAAEEAAKTQIRQLTALLNTSWDSITIAQHSFEAARTNYQLTEQAFRNGTVESLVLADARNNMASARQRLLQSELSYFNMILDLSSAINMDWKELIQTYGVSGERN
jgi:multidrug efflux system outer membrane protein